MREDLNLLDLAGELEFKNDLLWVLSEPGARKSRGASLSARLSRLTLGIAILASVGCDIEAPALDSPDT